MFHHLPDLPGFTRSVYRRDHALISPESHVYGPLPDWYLHDFFPFIMFEILSLVFMSNNCFYRIDTSAAYLIAPQMGSHFVMYLAKLQGSITSEFVQFICSFNMGMFVCWFMLYTFSDKSKSGLPPVGVERCFLPLSLVLSCTLSMPYWTNHQLLFVF